MDPATHLLASYTLGRAARAHLKSPVMAAALLAGAAPDLDWLWHRSGPLAPMRAYGTVTHSVIGAALLAAAIAVALWGIMRKWSATPAGLPPLLATSSAAAALHLLLDLCASTGIEPWWPVNTVRAAWSVTPLFDAVGVILLVTCALLPLLLDMVKEEIGARVDSGPSRVWPVTALVLMAAWVGARAVLHHRAEQVLAGATYKGEAALHWGAFPAGTSPFRWRGIVETGALLVEADVALDAAQPLSMDGVTIHYKPEPSPAVEAAAAAPLARAYTGVAQFPVLTVEVRPDGARAELHELGDSLLHTRDGAWNGLIELDPGSQVVRQSLYFVAAKSY